MRIKSMSVMTALLCMSCLGAMAQNNFIKFQGKVIEPSGKGIANVVVNNGSGFTTTDKDGYWILPTDTNFSKFISISTPANYHLPSKNSVANGFYVSVSQLAQNKSHDFFLEKRKAANEKICYIAISDPQVKSDKHVDRWKSETVKDLKLVTDSISKEREVVSVSLGDIVWDNMHLYDDYIQSLEGLKLTSFQCIGNHDFDLRYQGLNNMPEGTPVHGEMVYEKYFGPTDYSFNLGKAHFITLKNINYMGGKAYREGITGAQLEWLKNDLSFVPKGSLVIISMHAACWNKIEKEGNVCNAKALVEVLKDYNVHVFAGHTHFAQNNEVSEKLYEHNIGAACGAWWKSHTNRCGAPNGYMIVDIDGESLRWHYKPTNQPANKQMTVYADGEFASHPYSIVANVWDYDSRCKVEWSEDGVKKGLMEQFTGIDKTYATIQSICKTPHLFFATPSVNAKTVTVTFTNRWGEKFAETIKLERKYESVKNKRPIGIIAHRGYWSTDDKPQNSIASLLEAAEAGVYGSEFDVQMTKDGVPIVNHDPTVGGLVIAQSNYQDIMKVRLANGEAIPLLTDFLDKGKKLRGTKLILEIKRQPTIEAENQLTEKVVRMVEEKGMEEQIEYISFSLNICEGIRSISPKAYISYVNGDLSPKEVKDKGFNGIDYELKVLLNHPEWVKDARSLGLSVNIWTPDSHRELTNAIALEPDFITTNQPETIRRLLSK